jgi:hypothetical protein
VYAEHARNNAPKPATRRDANRSRAKVQVVSAQRQICQLLASGTDVMYAKTSLIELAEEFEAMAEQLDGCPGRRGHSLHDRNDGQDDRTPCTFSSETAKARR